MHPHYRAVALTWQSLERHSMEAARADLNPRYREVTQFKDPSPAEARGWRSSLVTAGYESIIVSAKRGETGTLLTGWSARPRWKTGSKPSLLATHTPLTGRVTRAGLPTAHQAKRAREQRPEPKLQAGHGISGTKVSPNPVSTRGIPPAPQLEGGPFRPAASWGLVPRT